MPRFPLPDHAVSRLPTPHASQGWAATLRTHAARSIQVVRSWASGLGRRLRSLTPEQWFFLGFTLLIAAFLVVLFFQPSSVGRGGR